MEQNKKYTAKYFRDNHPTAKNKKSSWLVRIFFRRISFYASSMAYRCGLTANRVSFIGLVLAFVATGFMVIPNRICNILSVFICCIWVISDCVDGNLARNVAKQPYGEFIDACGSYTIVAFLLPAVGFAAYQNNNSLLMTNSPWIILLGAFGGLFDTMARLYFQKYKNEKMILEGKTEESKSEKDKTKRLYDIYMRLSKEIGLTGLFIPFMLVSVLFGWLDVFVIFYCLFYGFNYLISTIMLLVMTGCLKK